MQRAGEASSCVPCETGECDARSPYCGILGAVKGSDGTPQFIQAAIFDGATFEGDARDAAGIGSNKHGRAAARRLRQCPSEGGGVQGRSPARAAREGAQDW